MQGVGISYSGVILSKLLISRFFVADLVILGLRNCPLHHEARRGHCRKNLQGCWHFVVR